MKFTTSQQAITTVNTPIPLMRVFNIISYCSGSPYLFTADVILTVPPIRMTEFNPIGGRKLFSSGVTGLDGVVSEIISSG